MTVAIGSVNAATAVQAPVKPGSRAQISGLVNYADRPTTTDKLYLNIGTDEEFPSNLVLSETEVTVHDVRPVQSQLSLEKNGFVLRKLEVPSLNWKDKNEIETVLYPLVEKLLREITKASRVHIFDHTLRHGVLTNHQGKLQIPKEDRQPVGMAHVDYTHNSGIDRLDALLPDEADKLRKTPFAVIQVWRPLRGPVRNSPLGMIDASTVESKDLTPYEIRFPGRTGHNFAVHHNPKHKWYFADQMETDEAYVFVCYDSRVDRARFTPHSGFQDPSVDDDAPPRESVELRAYVFWEAEAPQELQRVW